MFNISLLFKFGNIFIYQFGHLIDGHIDDNKKRKNDQLNIKYKIVLLI